MKTTLLSIVLAVLSATSVVASQPQNARRMTFLHYNDARFLEGLKKYGFPNDHGFRLMNTGFVVSPFGPRWLDSPALAKAKASGRPYYIDRITGGMPFQPLDGIEEVAERLKDDQNFLGFQVHEWGNSPMADHGRISKLMVGKGLPFNKENAAKYEGRTSLPFFSGGTYETYKDLYRPLKSLADLRQYLETYFARLVKLTDGQVMSVSGHFQLHHTALRLGAKNVMAEIGNQVPLTALQIACARGAARQHGKPFGVYYETWGGSPFGCTCATSFSPWFADQKQFDNFHDMGSVGAQFGSGRSLQERLLYYSWLSGAAWWSEEWGPENYFTDWKDYPMTEYGVLTKAFLDNTAKIGPVTPITPAAIVLPPDTFGIHTSYVANYGYKRIFHGVAEPDNCHVKLRKFAVQVLAAHGQKKAGGDSHNLTPSPWIGCFDVLSAEASPELLAKYKVVMFLDDKQAKKAKFTGPVVHVFSGQEENTKTILQDIQKSLPFKVEGKVGCVQAQTAERYLVGVFNNLGVRKTSKGEHRDPGDTQKVTVEGPCVDLDVITGKEYISEATGKSIALELPAGTVMVLSLKKP